MGISIQWLYPLQSVKPRPEKWRVTWKEIEPASLSDTLMMQLNQMCSALLLL